MKKFMMAMIAVFCMSGQVAQKPSEELAMTNGSQAVKVEKENAAPVETKKSSLKAKSAARKVVEGYETSQAERKSAAKRSMEAEIN
jgi:hypothetical protein